MTTRHDTATAREWADRMYSLLGMPAIEGNDVSVLRNGDEIFAAMLDAIERAERTVDLVTFVYWSGHIADRFARALAGAANRGCRVRVLLDALGARKLDPDVVDVAAGAAVVAPGASASPTSGRATPATKTNTETPTCAYEDRSWQDSRVRSSTTGPTTTTAASIRWPSR